MRKIIPLLLWSLIWVSCEKEPDSSDIVGEWQLIAMLADPGDGSGTFMPVVSNKRIEFFSDGTYISNGTICDFSTSAQESSEGNYTSIENRYEISCSGTLNFPIGLQLEDGSLIVSFPCIEPCQQRFRKIN